MAQGSIDIYERELLSLFTDSACLEWERRDFIFQGEMYGVAVETCKKWGWPSQERGLPTGGKTDEHNQTPAVLQRIGARSQALAIGNWRKLQV